MRSRHVGDLTPSTSFPKAAKAKAKQSECIGTWSQLSTNITSPQAQNAIVVPTKVHPMLPRCWWCLSAILSVSRLASCLVGTLPVECHWITFAQGGWRALNDIRISGSEDFYAEDAKRVQGTMDWSPSESQRARTCLTILTSASDRWQKWKKSKHTGLDKGRPGSMRLR